jgi:6,7-dimethyl-8-ribityllumazine synthase
MIDCDGVVRGVSQVSLAAVKARWADPVVQAMVARLQTLLNEKGPD